MKKSFTFIMQQANCFDALKVREDMLSHAVQWNVNFAIQYRYYQAQKSPKILQNFLNDILNYDHIRKMLLGKFQEMSLSMILGSKDNGPITLS